MVTATEIAEAVAQGRADMEALFTDLVKITAPALAGAKGTFNETTGQYDGKSPRRVIYHGPGRMQVKVDVNSNIVETTAGEREWTYTTSQLQLPAQIDTSDPRLVEGTPDDVDVDHICEMLSCPFQPGLEGHVFNVTGPFSKSHPVYLRFRVREVVG